MWREMIIFADRQSNRQTDTNSKTEAHSYPLWIVGERANIAEIQNIDKTLQNLPMSHTHGTCELGQRHKRWNFKKT